MKIKIKDVMKFKKMLILEGLSGKTLSSNVGVSHAYVVQIINGKRYPSPKVAKKIIDTLNVKFDDIFFIEDDNKYEQEVAGVNV